MNNTNRRSMMSLVIKPRHWPMAAGLALMWLIHFLPMKLQFWVGKKFGHFLYHFAKRRRHIAEINIDLCFPALDKQQRKNLLIKTFESAGISTFEVPIAWWSSDERLRPLAHFHGLEHIKNAQRQGKGILLLVAHFICLEIGGRLLNLEVPTNNMYKKHHNPLFEAVMTKCRLEHLEGLVEHRNVREFIRILKQGRVGWYVPDQDFGKKGQSVFAPFMGVQTATLTAGSRFAKMGDAAVIPFFPRRRLDGTGYDIIILPPIENFPSGDDEKDAAIINETIQEQVLLEPDQYLWLHRRFKSRPEGQPNVYKTK